MRGEGGEEGVDGTLSNFRFWVHKGILESPQGSQTDSTEQAFHLLSCRPLAVRFLYMI